MTAWAKLHRADLISGACFVAVLGLFVYAFIYTPPSPLQFIGGDAVYPTVAHAGDTVYVRRNFVALETAPVRITRRMMNGDCSKDRKPDVAAGAPAPFKGCIILDLATTDTVFEIGEHPGVWRPHVIPSTAIPGTWRLEFFMDTHNKLGRAITYPLPVVTVEIVK